MFYCKINEIRSVGFQKIVKNKTRQFRSIKFCKDKKNCLLMTFHYAIFSELTLNFLVSVIDSNFHFDFVEPDDFLKNHPEKLILAETSC